jgi:hypothetical protein
MNQMPTPLLVANPCTTRALPSTMPRPQLLAYDAGAASPDRWLLGAVEDSTGGCPDMSCYYDGGLFWVYIDCYSNTVNWVPADDTHNKMVGNTVLIDDLYALNGGPK